MRIIHTSPKVKFFCGVLYSKDFPPDGIRKALENLLGPVDHTFGPVDFDFTKYYSREMGDGIRRCFYSFSPLLSPEALAQVKCDTNSLEENLARLGDSPHSRPVNLDPGYVEMAKVILASAKNFYHRIYQSKGIWAEVTLYYKNREWQSFPWTFPGYASGLYHPFFHKIREIYKNQLKEQ